MMLNEITKAEQPACRCFSMSELSSATNNFDEKWCIGHGGFGKVYKGKVSDGLTNFLYAVKRLHFDSHQGATEFWVEVKMLSRLRHCNIVPLIGYCNEGNEMALVYEYMPNGTLYDHLHKEGTNLTWSQRHKICIGAARGLDYQHTGTGTRQGVIHRDVKSSNNLLDENYDAKIADFGLAKIGPTNQACTYVSTTVKGTFGYMDPNYFYTGRLTRKSDVYAFRVVLVEVLSGRPALDESLEEGLAIWAQDLIERGKFTQIVSSSLRDHISKSSLTEYSSIAARCLLSLPNQRPTMTEVGCSSRELVGFCDTSYGMDQSDGRGTTGMAFYYGGALISWLSQKQQNVALLSCESEYMAATSATYQSIWLKGLLSELTGHEEKAVTLHMNNRSAIDLMKNPVFNGRSKHINIRFHFIRECIERGEVQVEHISGEKQNTNILTKALPKLKFEEISKLLGIEDLKGTNQD